VTVIVFTLRRTDTTLDLSQKAEKGMISLGGQKGGIPESSAEWLPFTGAGSRPLNFGDIY
jgi:hypothetical protein